MEKPNKYSRKREAILDALRTTNEHPTAEWLYTHLKPQFPDLSLGTVYRNLSLFRTNGDVVCVGTFGGQERYDANLAPHSHFVCQQCHAVIDLDASFTGTEHFEDIRQLMGCEVYSSSVYFKGLCPDCAAQNTI